MALVKGNLRSSLRDFPSHYFGSVSIYGWDHADGRVLVSIPLSLVVFLKIYLVVFPIGRLLLKASTESRKIKF